MFGHVLIPLDGTPVAEAAIPYATRMLDAKGKITLVTAVDMARFRSPEGQLRPLVRATAQRYREAVRRLLPDAMAYLEGVRSQLQSSTEMDVELHAELCDAATYILRIAERCGADVIVMVSYRRSGVSRWLFGSVTARVVSTAPCPVLVIPGNDELADPIRQSEVRMAAE